MDNENEFELGGKVYISNESGGECIGCAFLAGGDCELSFDLAPPCNNLDRTDGADVIFVEKRP